VLIVRKLDRLGRSLRDLIALDLKARKVTHARKLLEQGERPTHVAQLLNVSRRTLEGA